VDTERENITEAFPRFFIFKLTAEFISFRCSILHILFSRRL